MLSPAWISDPNPTPLCSLAAPAQEPMPATSAATTMSSAASPRRPASHDGAAEWSHGEVLQSPLGLLDPHGGGLSGRHQGDDEGEQQEGQSEVEIDEGAVPAESAESCLDTGAAGRVLGGGLGDRADEDGKGADREQPAQSDGSDLAGSEPDRAAEQGQMRRGAGGVGQGRRPEVPTAG